MPTGPGSAASIGSGIPPGCIAPPAGTAAAAGTMPGAAWGFRVAKAAEETENRFMITIHLFEDSYVMVLYGHVPKV